MGRDGSRRGILVKRLTQKQKIERENQTVWSFLGGIDGLARSMETTITQYERTKWEQGLFDFAKPLLLSASLPVPDLRPGHLEVVQ
jgi:hypothetical protein